MYFGRSRIATKLRNGHFWKDFKQLRGKMILKMLGPKMRQGSEFRGMKLCLELTFPLLLHKTSILSHSLFVHKFEPCFPKCRGENYQESITNFGQDWYSIFGALKCGQCGFFIENSVGLHKRFVCCKPCCSTEYVDAKLRWRLAVSTGWLHNKGWNRKRDTSHAQKRTAPDFFTLTLN